MHEVEVKVDGAVVWRSFAEAVAEPGPQVRNAEDIMIHERFSSIRSMPQEVFAIATLNGANKVLNVRWITVGLLDSNQVHPREVFAPAITDRAASIILAHNHPSGTLQPSPEDMAITNRLIKAGEILGIRVLDHIILTSSGHLSMKLSGHM